MGILRDRMETDMKLRNLRPATQALYLDCVGRLAKHYRRSPADLGREEVRDFLAYLLEERRLSPSTLQSHRAAFRFLYEITLDRPEAVKALPLPMVRRKTPHVLSGSEVALVLRTIRSYKLRMLATTIYGAGLRVSEACKLEVSDIDGRRMLIRVRDGKGGRDRYALLSPGLYRRLREYWRLERPRLPYLFPDRTQRRPLGRRSLQNVLREAARECGITKRVTAHVLRHSFAVHLLELGVDTRIIQVLLGHLSIRTTQRYAHVSTDLIGRSKSPLDVLHTEEGKVLG